MVKSNPLGEAKFEDVIVEVLAASPMYTTRDAIHFDAVTLLDAEQLWGLCRGDPAQRTEQAEQAVP